MRQENREARKRQPVEVVDDKEQQEMEAEMERIISGPRENEEQLRDQFKEVTDLADRLAKKGQEMADKQKTQQEQLDRLAKKPKKEGPAKEMEDALARGDFDKAREEAERLSKALEEDTLSKEEKDQLKEQVEELDHGLPCRGRMRRSRS